MTASATGAHTSFHTGSVRSTQLLRLQASRCPGAGMNSVAVSSHRSATWRAWRVDSATAAVTVGSPSPRACWRASSWPICQLTGSAVEAENICWNWARIASSWAGLSWEMSPTPGIWAMELGSTPDERRALTASEAICSPNSDASIFSSSSKASSLTGFPLAGSSLGTVRAVWGARTLSLTALWSHPFLCRGYVPFADGVPAPSRSGPCPPRAGTVSRSCRVRVGICASSSGRCRMMSA